MLLLYFLQRKTRDLRKWEKFLYSKEAPDYLYPKAIKGLSHWPKTLSVKMSFFALQFSQETATLKP